MRSFSATLVLLLAVAGLCGVAAWQWREGGFEALFGTPPVPVGSLLYPDLDASEVKQIRVSSGEARALFSLTPNGWIATEPWQDRMDPRSATGIIRFAGGLRVEDLAEIDDTDPAQTGLGEAAVRIRLDDSAGRPLAMFRMGRSAPWRAEFEDIEEPVATVFIQPRERHRRDHAYVCSGDINPLFREGMRFLRDHRPFYFNPLALQRIRIRGPQGDLLLGRETPQSQWRIVKPLDLPTDPASMKRLLEGLYELHATRVSDRTGVTMPAENPEHAGQIAITRFGAETETILEIHPPESPDNRDVLATVSDRPQTVLHLPVKPEPGLVTLANLPLEVNALRDPALTHLNIASLRGIAIQPATGREIILTHNPPQPWMVVIDGPPQPANEENLFSLLKAVTGARAEGFESDAATDFAPWGLDRPVLTLRFLGQDNQALELRFGIDGRGGVFANRLGSPSVMRVDPELLREFATRAYEWRHSRLWSLSRVYLRGLERAEADQPPLELSYDDNLESWKARREGADLSGALDPNAANLVLTTLEELRVNRWLATTDEAALAALSAPSLRFRILEEIRDDDFRLTGFSDRTLVLAPSTPGPNPGFYYGRLTTEAHPFLIDRETYRKLAAPLLD